MQRFYITPSGKKYPLYEADYQYKIDVYKKDCRKAVVGDPEQCLIALGARRDKDVLSAHIGSSRDAYIIFKGKHNAADERMRVDHARHFTIPAKEARVRDYFDTHKGTATMSLKLAAPTAGRTLAARAKMDKARREKIKNGTHVVKPRKNKGQSRIIRIGVAHRPKAIIEKNIVHFPERDETAA